MKRILIAAIATLLSSTIAYAADNALVVTVGSGTTMRSVDVGAGVQAPGHALVNAAGTQIGISGAPLFTQLPSGAVASGAVASGAFASGSISSGAVASGAVASGAFASGSLASGAGTDGWDATQGATGDAAATQGSTGTVSAKLRLMTSQLNTISSNTGAALPAGTNSVGQVGFDPSSGKGTPTFAFLAMPATTTTQIIALSGVTVTYVTSIAVIAGGTVNVTLKHGTGSNCGTGTTTLAGPYPLTAQAGWTQGSGTGPVIIVPSGKALCITTDASVGGGVHLTYQQI